MSVNHQFYHLQDNIYKRYKKTCVVSIGGTRPDPADARLRIGWTLGTSAKNFDFNEKKVIGFDYTDEVIETYSEAEDRVFRRLNRALFTLGYLVEYGESEPEPDTSNELTDKEITDMLKIIRIDLFVKRLELITSKQTLKRIKEQAIELNKSYKFVKEIDDRLLA